MNTNLTFDERERTAFADGDTYTAGLIRDAQYAAQDDMEPEHDAALDVARQEGYEQGVEETTPEDIAKKVEALEDELAELRRHYKVAYATIQAAAPHIKGDLCKTIKGRAELHRQIIQRLINLPKEI